MSHQPEVALIIGSERRIGAESAQKLARQGLELALHCDSIDSFEEARQLRHELLSTTHTKAKISIHFIDLDNAAAAEQLVSEVVLEHKKIDIVVNSVGSAVRKPNISHSGVDYTKLLAYAVFVDEQRRKYVDLYRTSLQKMHYSS